MQGKSIKIIMEKNMIIGNAEVRDYIINSLYEFKKELVQIDNAKYHHNTSYKDAASICKFGIMSLSDLSRARIKDYSKDFLEIMSDTDSHINGIDGVSLSVVGLKDLYFGEMEYDPYINDKVDFLISSNITARRRTYHYGNEFICYDPISVNEIMSMDIRLIDYLTSNINSNELTSNSISMYNHLIDVAKIICDLGLCLKMREMSSESYFSLDINKLSNAKKISTSSI